MYDSTSLLKIRYRLFRAIFFLRRAMPSVGILRLFRALLLCFFAKGDALRRDIAPFQGFDVLFFAKGDALRRDIAPFQGLIFFHH